MSRSEAERHEPAYETDEGHRTDADRRVVEGLRSDGIFLRKLEDREKEEDVPNRDDGHDRPQAAQVPFRGDKAFSANGSSGNDWNQIGEVGRNCSAECWSVHDLGDLG